MYFIKNHRFRQDGIEKNPTVLQKSGVLPYSAGGQAQKYLQILRFIPEKTISPYVLPYDIINDIERVSLIKTRTSLFRCRR